MRALVLCALALTLAACASEDVTAGSYAVSRVDMQDDCFAAPVPRPELTRLVLNDDGTTTAEDSAGRVVPFATWERLPDGAVQVHNLKIIGWWAGEVRLEEAEDGGLSGEWTWNHGESLCDARTELKPE